MKVHSFIFNTFGECCSVVSDETGNAAVIDPGFATTAEQRELYDYISTEGLKPGCVILTHAHFDHIYGLKKITEDFDLPVYMTAEDKEMFKNNERLCPLFDMPVPEAVDETRLEFVKDGGHIKTGELDFEVLATPGHTPGGMCLLEKNGRTLFSGDTLFAGSIGRTDSPWGDYDALMKSIFEKLMVLDGDIRVIPGHGPETTIADERTKNPFLEPFNEPVSE